jgi:hypothetical protein
MGGAVLRRASVASWNEMVSLVLVAGIECQIVVL